MNNLSSLQERAAAYALSISEEPVEFEHELAESAVLSIELASFQSVVGTLAYSVSLFPLPTDLKIKLFDRINRLEVQPGNLLELLEWPISELQQVSLDLQHWETMPIANGAERVIWQVDEVHAQVAFFLRIPNGGMIPRHFHATGESTLVLAGTFTNDNGQVYEVGDLFMAAANTSHQPSTSPGCLILCITHFDPFPLRV
jgi:hypothetical protein